MRTRAFWVAILVYLITGHAQLAMAQVDQQRAQEYFKDVQAVCEREGLRLWGMSLCGPMVIADPLTVYGPVWALQPELPSTVPSTANVSVSSLPTMGGTTLPLPLSNPVTTQAPM